MPEDIIVTLPATVAWDDYERELDAVADGSAVMRFSVARLPVRDVIGGRCYVVHRGLVAGWMEITGTHSGSFTCTTTGREWGGRFVERSGPFRRLPTEVAHRGFQGWRYLRGRPGEG